MWSPVASTPKKRVVQNRPLGIHGITQNRRINRKRTPEECPFAVIKREFNASYMRGMTMLRVHVKMDFVSFFFTNMQWDTLTTRHVSYRRLGGKRGKCVKKRRLGGGTRSCEVLVRMNSGLVNIWFRKIISGS